MQENVSPVSVGHALESLRNSDFDTLSAIGEVIDNSIEAEAREIKINIKTKSLKGRRKPVFEEFAFGDDGKGMYEDILHRCLVLGYSTSYNDRKGIGRFGVGMTLGAIAQCRRIEVYSKPRGGDWKYTHIDLEEIKKDSDPRIPKPVPKEVPNEYSGLIGDHGTLVIWRKLDRASDVNIEDIVNWVGRTFRKFIGKELIENDKVVPNPQIRKIILNDEPVPAHDPLFVTKNEKFPSDPCAELAHQIELPWDIPTVDPPPDRHYGSSTIIIRFSLLPKEWREEIGSGGSDESKKRYIPHNEGVSILRNNREVLYGHIPHFRLSDQSGGSGFIDIDRFWGCEISFDAVLDNAFSVKNIKVGARPAPELREALYNMMQPTIYDYRKTIRADRDKHENAKQRVPNSNPADLKTGQTLKDITPERNVPENKKEEAVQSIMESAGIKKEEIPVFRDQLLEYPCVIKRNDELHPRGNFIDVVARGGKTLVDYNMRHPFFSYIYSIISRIEDSAREKNPENIELLSYAEKLNICVNLLVTTFATIGNMMDKEDTQRVGDVIDALVTNWSTRLRDSIERVRSSDEQG